MKQRATAVEAAIVKGTQPRESNTDKVMLLESLQKLIPVKTTRVTCTNLPKPAE
jgi:hypothetical protein